MCVLGMSGADLQDRDQGTYGHFFTERGLAIFNVDPCPRFIYLFRAQFVAELRRTCNVTLANLWIKCLQFGNISN